MTVDEIITEILRREGGDKYTDHPADRGGPTKWGITLAAWAAYLGRTVTAADVQAIDEPQAREFYRRRYILAPGFDKVADPYLRELLIDAGVNHGPANPIRWLQAAAEVKVDGRLGPVSLAAVNSADPLELFLWILAARFKLYGRLTSRDPALQRAKRDGYRTQAENTEGWCNRAAEFIEDAAKMIEAEHNAAKGAP